jgi:DNA helicase-2/ATP-dependent DNA helicase PcrA
MMIRKKCVSDADRRALGVLIENFKGAKTENAEEFLREFIAGAELSASRADLFFAKQNAIPLLTVHQAKGCEFDTVILAGADDRNFPSFFSRSEKALEEEKKVFYVAISRAKKKLVLTKAAYNGRNETFPSPYTKKIPEEYLWKNERWDIND